MWETINKETEITQTTYIANQLPKTYYVEGYDVSSSIKDTEIVLSYTSPDGTTEYDRAKLTVYNIKFNDPIETRYIPKPETGNPYYIVEAQINPPDAFGGRLYWSWQDPSPQNTGNAPIFYFQQVDGWDFHSQTEPYSIPDHSGKVRCQFNLYDGAGDDGVVKVSTLPGGWGESAISGKIMVAGTDLKIDNLSEQSETETGAYIFLNWDDDNNNDVCDKDESNVVSNEDDIIPFNLTIIPDNTNQGTIELSAPSGSSKIKIWTSPNKATQITLPKTWNLAQEPIPSTLYVEGIQKSETERDIVLRIKYTNNVNGVNKSTQDEIKLTVVNLKLGYAVYRYLSTWGVGWYRHVGIIGKYEGERNKADIKDLRNYIVYDMQTDGMREVNLSIFTEEHTPYFGEYTISNLTDENKIKILKTLSYLRNRGIQYPGGTIPYAILVSNVPPSNGTITINNITHLRCDALIEVCYEANGINVWGYWDGHNPYYFYNIMDHPQLHNNRPDLSYDPYQELSPLAQSGDDGNYNTNFRNKSYKCPYEPIF